MRLLRGCAFVLLYLALFFAGLYAVEDWRGTRAWDGAVREAREHGGATDFASAIPPPVPDNQNLAMAPLFATALNYQVDPETKQLTFGSQKNGPLLDGIPLGQNYDRPRPTTSNWQKGRPADLRGWQTYFRGDPAFPQAPDPQSPAEGVLLALSRYKAPLDELAIAAAERPRSRFPINWTAPSVFMIPLRQTELLIHLANALSIRASAEVASGKQAEAVADIALGFRLSEAMTNDPMLIDHLVSDAIIGMLAQPIWDGLAARSWNADQLQKLQTLLSRQDALASYAAALRTEEASVSRGVDYLERHADGRDIPRIMAVGEPPNLSFTMRLFYGFVAIAPKGWYDQNKARLVHFEQKYVLGAIDPAAHRVFPSVIEAGMAERSATRVSGYTFYFLLSSDIFESPLVRAARAQVNCDQATMACALERYFLDQGNYPSDLAALTPAYISKLPNDVVDGAPMRYQLTADGRYRLYSIGWNARDDGGRVAWAHNSQRVDDKSGDWVWQYLPMQTP
jgi:hypothetical protein